jgi:EpsI family protein
MNIPGISRTGAWCLALTVTMLAGTLLATKLAGHRNPQPLALPLTNIPTQIDGWSGTSGADVPEEVQGALKATSLLSRVYQRGGSAIDLFIAFYAEQRAGESMHSPRVCLPGSGWEISAYGSEQVPVGNERYTINRYVVQKGLERMTVLYWYQSRSSVVASEYLGKILLIRNTIMDGATAGSIVRLTFPDRPGAVPEAVGLASHLIPEVRKCIGE